MSTDVAVGSALRVLGLDVHDRRLSAQKRVPKLKRMACCLSHDSYWMGIA